MWLWSIIDFLWLAAAYVIFIDLIIMLPLSLFKITRLFAARFIFFSSYLFGFMLWIESALYTFELWGIVALIIGLVILGLGVIPMAFLALAIHGIWDDFFLLLVTLMVAIIVKYFGAYLLERFE